MVLLLLLLLRMPIAAVPFNVTSWPLGPRGATVACTGLPQGGLNGGVTGGVSSIGLLLPLAAAALAAALPPPRREGIVSIGGGSGGRFSLFSLLAAADALV